MAKTWCKRCGQAIDYSTSDPARYLPKREAEHALVCPARGMTAIDRLNVALRRAEESFRLQYRVAAHVALDPATELHYRKASVPARWGLYVVHVNMGATSAESVTEQPLKDTPLATRMQAALLLPRLAELLAQAATEQRNEITKVVAMLETWLETYEAQAIELPDTPDKLEND